MCIYEDAREVATYADDIRCGYSPEGFEFLGEGAQRIVLRKGKHVFKVELETIEGELANFTEYSQFADLADIDLPANVALPFCDMITEGETDVIIMEYVEGRYAGYSDTDDTVLTLMRDYNLIDSCLDNIVIRDGIYYLVDLGTTS